MSGDKIADRSSLVRSNAVGSDEVERRQAAGTCGRTIYREQMIAP
jgi:hypothetical protein